MQLLQKLFLFFLFLFLFFILDASPKIEISTKNFSIFNNERDAFFKAIDELCCHDLFRNDVASFSEQEKRFFSSLIDKIIDINVGLNKIADQEILNFLNDLILQFNQAFPVFMDEWGLRYKELNRILCSYLEKPQNLAYSLILTKYELLREKEAHIAFRLDTIYNLLQLLCVICCIFRRQAFA